MSKPGPVRTFRTLRRKLFLVDARGREHRARTGSGPRGRSAPRAVWSQKTCRRAGGEDATRATRRRWRRRQRVVLWSLWRACVARSAACRCRFRSASAGVGRLLTASTPESFSAVLSVLLAAPTLAPWSCGGRGPQPPLRRDAPRASVGHAWAKIVIRFVMSSSLFRRSGRFRRRTGRRDAGRRTGWRRGRWGGSGRGRGRFPASDGRRTPQDLRN